MSKNCNNLIRAFKVYIRPLLEYASPIWSPCQVSQIIALESVQRKFTKRIPGLHHLPYGVRLARLNLHTLEHRRLIYDLVLCFKIVHGCSSLLFSDFFTFTTNKTSRGHPYRLSPPLLKSNLHKFSFSYRIVSSWNSLPENIVTASNVVVFKHHLLKQDLSKFLIIPF